MKRTDPPKHRTPFPVSFLSMFLRHGNDAGTRKGRPDKNKTIVDDARMIPLQGFLHSRKQRQTQTDAMITRARREGRRGAHESPPKNKSVAEQENENRVAAVKMICRKRGRAGNNTAETRL